MGIHDEKKINRPHHEFSLDDNKDSFPIVSYRLENRANATMTIMSDGRVIMGDGAESPTTERITASHVINVKDYGAVGNGVADDTAAIQAAVNACTTSQNPVTTVRQQLHTLYVPAGDYRITSPIRIVSSQGFNMEGDGYKSFIYVSGGLDLPNALDINGVAQGVFRNFQVSGPTLGSGAGKVDAVIDYYWDSTKSARSTSGCVFENIWIGGRFVTGFGVSRLSNGAKQVDHTSWRQITVTGGGSTNPTLWQQGFYWGSGSQGNQTDFYLFGSGVAGCKYGHFLGTAKHITMIGGSNGDLNTAFWYNGAQGYIHISGMNFESVGRLWDSFGATGSPISICLENIDYAVNTVASDGIWFRHHAPGMLTLRNVLHDSIQVGFVTPLQIRSTPATGKLNILLEGVQFYEPLTTCFNINSNVQTTTIGYVEKSRIDSLVANTPLGIIHGDGFWEVPSERLTDPPAPELNGARIFMRDSGSGKTQLCIRFATGAVQVLATEP